MAQLPNDRGHAWEAREARRERVERQADSYRGPQDYRPRSRDSDDVAGSLLGVLTAGLVLLALILAVYFLWPRGADMEPGLGVRVPLAGTPALPEPPRLPEPPALPPRLGG